MPTTTGQSLGGDASPRWSPLPLKALPRLYPLALAVVGHTEVVTFVKVERLPRPGEVSHGRDLSVVAAGGGPVVAAQMARLMPGRVRFLTALGRDAAGEQAAVELARLGLDLRIAWRDSPTRRAITFVEASGERAITVIGERLAPAATDPVDWGFLAHCDGVFVTACDAEGLRLARRARVLNATPRVRRPTLCIDSPHRQRTRPRGGPRRALSLPSTSLPDPYGWSRRW